MIFYDLIIAQQAGEFAFTQESHQSGQRDWTVSERSETPRRAILQGGLETMGVKELETIMKKSCRDCGTRI